MAIFSRRILQRLLTENSEFLTKGQTRKYVRELNTAHNEPTLAFEWEVVLVNAFSKVGKVRHEEPLGNGKGADIYFEVVENPHQNFTVDITTASDKGLNENNPFQLLWDELIKRASTAGIKPNYFDLKAVTTSRPDTKAAQSRCFDSRAGRGSTR